MSMKEVTVAGFVAGLIFFIIVFVLRLNPFLSSITSQYGTWVGAKSPDSFNGLDLSTIGLNFSIGGFNVWLLLTLLSSFVLTFFMAVLYSYTESGILLSSAWKKGLFFGFLMGLVIQIPSAYYRWLTFTYPDVLNILDMLNNFLATIIAGIFLAVVYESMFSSPAKFAPEQMQKTQIT